MSDLSAEQLLEKIMNQVDRTLSKNGLEFRESECWDKACARMEKFIFRFYEDFEEADGSYHPGDSQEEVEEHSVDMEDADGAEHLTAESVSATLESESD